MSTFHKIAAACAIGAFAGLIIFSIISHLLETKGIVRNREAAATVAKLTSFSLFLVLGYSLIPLMLHVFVVAQGGIGNSDVGMVRFLREHERGVTYFIWGFFTTGLLIALPVMWTDMFGLAPLWPRTKGNAESSQQLASVKKETKT
jgi:hypothetical protein